ncbi:MAG: beta-phosphoglucomutase [Bacteroidota bacterium]|nr:beta-phosphoglucomutase [Bacteroidota bacterium]
MIKGLIFDLDGVIVDTAKYHYKAWKDLAAELGFEFTEKDNEQLKGVSRMTSLDILFKTGNISGVSEAEKLKMAESKNKQYVSYVDKMEPGEILPGALKILSEAKNKGLKVALGSASKNAVRILKRVEIESYFDAIIDGTKVKKAKPDSEVFLKGAEAMGLKPEECIVFEDAQAGIEAAKAGNFHAVGIGDENILKDADYILPGFVSIDISEIINTLNT